MTSWPSWHDAYLDPASGISRRLRVIQDQIGAWLDATAPRPVRVVSLCAGDGRDLVDVLSGRADAARVTATLVEIDPGLADAARRRAARLSLVEVRSGDAGDPYTYADLPPADLVLLCGVLGNVSDADARHTVEVLPALCAPGARVVWTRTRHAPDLTPQVRKWFSDNGFREVAFVAVPDSTGAVGVADLVSGPATSLGDRPLFTFVTDSPNRRTLAAYERRADRYRTALSGAWPAHRGFLDAVVAMLPLGARVLELGSGTGTDARYLGAAGLDVQPSDATLAFLDGMRRDGLDPRRLDVLSDDLGGPWDAVVAFAMLLHLTRDELAAVLVKVEAAVRPGGLLAFSVKEGDGSSWSAHKLGLPRFFTFWRAEPLAALLSSTGWSVRSLDRHAGERDDWLHVIATPTQSAAVSLDP